jgi:glycosyltransferase involved in cell wall biosynthesis
MSRRLVILTEIIAPYRIPVFNALAKREDIDLHVIFLAENDPELRDWLVYKDEIRFSYQVLPSWRRRFAGYGLLLNRGLKAALRQAAPNMILCGGYNYLASWQSMQWANGNDVPFVLWVESTEQDSRNRHRWIELLKAKFLKRCRGFVVPGKASYHYIKNYGARQEDIFTAPNAVDIELFARRSAAVRQNTVAERQALQLPRHFFLFVGRLVAGKGVFDLLEAYRKLTPELRAVTGLVLVGEGPARVELVRRAKQIELGQVQCTGFVHREQLAGYYGLADVFVFPSHTDPWGLVVNEAMACGLPVISSDAAGCTADLVEDNWNGRVVRHGDVAQLASAMEELGRDRALSERMGNHSQERILAYSPEACADGIAQAAISLSARP